MEQGGKPRLARAWWRRLAQAAFLLLFLFLFRKTDYQGSDELPYAVNIFFRWDPLVAASAMLASRAFIALLLPSLAVIALTLVFGRFFCGWVCPLGTLLDCSRVLIKEKNPGPAGPRRAWKFYLLAVVLIAALFGLPLVGYFDPFSLLVRGLALALDPALNLAATKPFDLAYQHGPEWLTRVSEPLYEFLRNTLLPYRQTGFRLALLSFSILAFIFGLELVERRFWCRNLCPLGALLALFGRHPLLRLHPGRACKKDGCRDCIEVCRMGAIQEDGRISPESCNLCLDCLDRCERSIITFRFKKPKPQPAATGITRRGFAAAAATGLVLPAVVRASRAGRSPSPRLIRPPGAQAELDFLARCVRCGECMKVCITNGLQPALWEAGVEGMFTPVLVPRVGYCEFNCTLCGQACPTGAIARLTPEEKHKVKMGKAVFDHDRCLPWAKGEPCIVCEEMCPLPEKAIKLEKAEVVNYRGERVTVQRPYLVDELCTGCGTCENKCPLPGEAAVRVKNAVEPKDF